jgi:tetratricopeptide (TPR) repeat protein
MNITTIQKQQFIKKIQQGEWDNALEFANHISRKDPENHLGYAMLGDALKQKGEYEKATSFYRFSLQKNPHQPGVYLALGEAYMLSGENEKALDSYSRALYMAPENIEILEKTGNFLVMSGYLDEARQVLEKSLLLGHGKAINSLLDLYIFRGEKDKLQEFINIHRESIQNHNGQFELARAELSLGRYQNTINILKPLNSKKRNSVWKRAYYNLMATAYEKMGKFNQAFQFYQQQNLQSSVGYDASQMENEVSSILQNVSKMEHLTPQSGDHLQTPFSPLFIIGLPRSGTSLLEQVLNTSTHVVTGGELLFIEAAYKKYTEDKVDLSEVARWYRDKIAIITKNQKVPKVAPRWVTDKLPSNFTYLGFIKNLLPDARFLYCKRNPMDNGLSIYKQNFLDTHSYASKQENIAHFISLERDIMQQWKSQYSDDIYTVQYEKLVSDFDSESRKIFDYCDLRWNDHVKNFYKNNYYCNTASFEQIRKPVHTKSVGLHETYSLHLQTLKQELLSLNVTE